MADQVVLVSPAEVAERLLVHCKPQPLPRPSTALNPFQASVSPLAQNFTGELLQLLAVADADAAENPKANDENSENQPHASVSDRLLRALVPTFVSYASLRDHTLQAASSFAPSSSTSTPFNFSPSAPLAVPKGDAVKAVDAAKLPSVVEASVAAMFAFLRHVAAERPADCIQPLHSLFNMFGAFACQVRHARIDSCRFHGLNHPGLVPRFDACRVSRASLPALSVT